MTTDNSAFTSDLVRLLDERGYIHQITDADALDKLATSQVVPGYIGFDATAPSLHVGSMVQIMMLRRLQQAGHKPIVLMGGGAEIYKKVAMMAAGKVPVHVVREPQLANIRGFQLLAESGLLDRSVRG